MELRQAWDLPARPRPIVVIGAGAIVRTAHLPAYRRVGFPVAGLFDIRPDAAAEAAGRFGIGRTFQSLRDACAVSDAVFDLAVPGDQILDVLQSLSAGSAVLIQKPMGEDLEAARAILRVCRERGLIAALNFQLRFSPAMLAVRDLLSSGILGDVTDIDVRLVVRQPWWQWEFMRGLPRLEVLYHSIHYLDVIRWLAGEPAGVYCRGVRHPELPQLADTRSSIILDYGDRIRCSLALNHTHRHDEYQRASQFKIEGRAGAAVVRLGVNLDYPSGPADRLEVVVNGGAWEEVPLRGSWFIEAFEGPMSNLQRFVSKEDAALVSPVADAIKTMAVVEACYISSAAGGTPVPEA